VKPTETWSGPWLVALGAGLWGTENAFRIPLSGVFDADVLVFWEHVILLAFAIPWIVPRLGELRRASGSTLAWLVFSGMAGSALGTVLFTLALAHGNPTVINVVLNIQPLLSTTAAVILFGDKLGRGFFLWAVLAIIAGMFLVGFLSSDFTFQLDAGIGYTLGVALLWGMSTVAGRAVMVEMSLPLAAGMRIVVGTICMVVMLFAKGLVHKHTMWPSGIGAQQLLQLLALGVVSGAAPLWFYFKGLANTRASTAGYFEMMQTVIGAAIAWLWFGGTITATQAIAGVALIGAVAMVQRVQDQTRLPAPTEP
jgi:drug/metabolite transporter (DMT)-like permease